MLLVLLVTPLSGAGIDVYVPSLPVIAGTFETTKVLAKLTIPAFLLGYGLGQPFFGTLSDEYGRRKPVLWGLFLFALTCGLAPLATTIQALLMFRLLQGLAVAGPASISKAVLTDCYHGEEHRRAFNLKAMVWAGGPILAPAVGGYLQSYFGWQSSFYFLALLAGLAWLLSLFFWVESNGNQGKLSVSSILGNYRTILRSRSFLGALICMGSVASIMQVFNVVGPFLVQGTLGYGPVDYGHAALVLGTSWFVGSVISKQLIGKLPHHTVISRGLWLGLIVAIAATVLAYKVSLGLWLLIVPTGLIYLVGGMVFPNCMARCLMAFPKMAGAASAVMGSLFVLAMAVNSALVSSFHSDSAVPLFVICGGLLVIGLLAFYTLRDPS